MKKSHIIAIAIIAIAVAAILSTVADSSTYASFRVAEEHPSKTYHVVGKLNKEKPQEYNPQTDANVFSFFLVDNEGQEKKVVLQKAKPQDFDKSEQIVVVGKMGDSDFLASDVLMKCPSKYNNPKEDIKSATTSMR
ncbi:MAG TPA: cytochrome c maturation protein CcmE [Bacteroidia bacterium]|nr:cytochrome c maturation protein CcmE [Bacteroidia bacterium]